MTRTFTTVFSVLAAVLLSANLGSALTTNQQISLSASLDEQVELRVLAALNNLPAPTRQAWETTTGQPIEDITQLIPGILQSLQGLDPKATGQESLDVIWMAAQQAVASLPALPALGPLGQNQPQAYYTGINECHTGLWDSLDAPDEASEEFYAVVETACTILQLAMLAVAPVLLAVFVVLAVVLIAVWVVTNAEPIANNVLALVQSAAQGLLENPPETCPPDCPAPPAPLPVPAAPNPNHVEFVLNGSIPNDPSDVDLDGVPDVWDAVNLPSEAQALTHFLDRLNVADGLPSSGFALLVPPGHGEAYLVAAEPFEVLAVVSSEPRDLTGAAALERIEVLQGQLIRNALATIIHEDMVVHYVPLAPETATEVSTPWSQPADGTWLLVNTDPTRLLQLTIAGVGIDLPSRAASHFSSNKTDYRWNFLNVHQGESFCYDPTTNLAGSACNGVHWPGWLRAYGGHAANALTSLQTSLDQDLIPFSLAAPSPIDNPTGRLVVPDDESPTAPDVSEAFALIAPLHAFRTHGVTRIFPTEDDGAYEFDAQTPGSTFTNWQLNINGSGVGPIEEVAIQLEGVNDGDDSLHIAIAKGNFAARGAPATTIQFTFKDASGVVHSSYYSEAANDANASHDDSVSLLAQAPTVAVFEDSLAGLETACKRYVEKVLEDCLDIEQDWTLPDDATAPEASSSSSFSGPSPWTSLGNASHDLPTGIGVDYQIDGSQLDLTSTVTQISPASLGLSTGIIPAEDARSFIFSGHYGSTPATPRNITHLSIGIQDADGNESAQAFLIDGRVLHDLLDIQPGDQLQAETDEDHEVGFQHVFRDVNGDAIVDLLVYIPHFTVSWVHVTNSNTAVTFAEVDMTSDTTAWMTPARVGGPTMYHYIDGVVQPYTLPDLNGHGLGGLHAISDTEFYVGVDCKYDNSPGDQAYIAHYRQDRQPQLTTKALPNCATLETLWVNNDGSKGFAGGYGMAFYKISGGAWVKEDLPSHCNIMAMELDAAGVGFIGINNPPDCTMTGVYTFNGSTRTAVTGSDGVSPWNIASPAGGWGTGYDGTTLGSVVLQASSSGWAKTSESVPVGKYYASAKRPGSDSYYFVGSQDGAGAIASRVVGSWAADPDAPKGGSLNDVDFNSTMGGLAVGVYGTLLRFNDYTPPIIVGSLTPSSGDTNTLFTADGTGTRNADGSTIAQEWHWGDGASYTNVATHRYNVPGTYTVRHRTWQQGNWVTGQTWSVAISAATLNVGQIVSGEFVPTAEDKAPSTAPTRSVHYQLPASSQDRVVSITLTETGALAPHPYLLARFALDGTAGSSGTGLDWPWDNAAVGRSAGRFEIPGLVPAGKVLDIEVSSYLYQDANIKDAYGSRTTNYGNVGFTLAAATALTPKTPTTSLVSGSTLPTVNVVATAPHNSATSLTKLKIAWGDGTTWESPYGAQTSQYYLGHTFARGAYTVTFTTQDQALQTATLSIPIAVHDIPAASTTGATMGATQGTFTGTVSDVGGAVVTAKYELYSPSGLIQTSSPYAMSSPGAMPAWVATGLISGAYYHYRVVATNDVGTTQTAYSNSNTAGPLGIVAQVQSNPTKEVGAASELALKASATHLRGVAYYVVWDTGASEIRYPSTGFVPWNQVVTATKVLPFPGTHATQVRIEDDLGSRSSPISTSTIVTGSSPTQNFQGSPGLSAVTLSATAQGLGVSSVKMRFGVRDTATTTWTNGAYFDASTGTTYSWSPSLDPAKTYLARIEMYDPTDNEAWKSSTITVRTNQAPTLIAGPLPATVSHLGTIRFAVTYRDFEGDAPRSQAGALQAPQLTVNGTTYTMHEDANAGYAVGASYYYQVPASALPQGLGAVPTYSVWDQYQRQVTQSGAAVYVAKEAHTYKDFEDQVQGATPRGMERSWEANNFWHVTDTQAMVDRLARGRHGKAAWFGNGDNGNYDAANSAGSLTTGVLDLRLAIDPSLSFSSYYETQDLGTQNDTKLVQIQVRNPAQSWWSSWTTIHQVSGYEGGFGAWRTQSVDLDAYEGKLVKVRFVFTANADNNRYLGWFIDDIVVGHDHDGDKLPDQLERTRSDISFVRQQVPTSVPDGGSEQMSVARLNRPLAERVVLDSVISHAQPEKLKVYLGGESPMDGTRTQTLVYDRGVIPSVCLHPFTHSPKRSNSGLTVNRTSDGLTVSIDLTACGLDYKSFQQQWDWSLEVNDPDADGKRAVIESLSLQSIGHTHPLIADTDDDGTTDGQEVAARQDPLGVDRDRDGIPESLDADDSKAAWLPAVALGLDEQGGSYSLRVYLLDEMEPTTTASFMLQGGAASGTSLPYTRAGSSWHVQWNRANMPDSVLMQWRDSVGGTGMLAVGLASNGASHRMQSLEMNYTSLESGTTTGWKIVDLGPQIALNVIVGTHRAYGAGMVGKTIYAVARGISSGDGWILPLPVKLVLWFSPWENSDTMKVRGPVQTQTVARQGDVQLFAGPGSLIVPQEFLPRLQAQGIQTSDLTSVGTFIAFPDPSGAMRTLHPVSDGLVVLNSMGHVVTDAWKWSNPSAQQSDWRDSVSQQWMVAAEKDLANDVTPGASTTQRWQARHCATACRYTDQGSIAVAIQDSGDGLSGQFSETPVNVPTRFLKAQWVNYNLNGFAPSFQFDARVTDALNGQVALWQAQTLAERKQLQFGAGGHWFWDGSSTEEVNCNDPSLNRNVPRCVKFTVDSAMDEHTFMNYWSGEEFQTLELDWKNFSGSGTSRTDAASVTGRIGPHEGFFLPAGKDTTTAFLEAMDTTMNGEDLSSYGAHVLAAYDWQIGKQPTAALYYKET